MNLSNLEISISEHQVMLNDLANRMENLTDMIGNSNRTVEESYRDFQDTANLYKGVGIDWRLIPTVVTKYNQYLGIKHLKLCQETYCNIQYQLAKSSIN